MTGQGYTTPGAACNPPRGADGWAPAGAESAEWMRDEDPRALMRDKVEVFLSEVGLSGAEAALEAEVAGPRGRHQADRRVYRYGTVTTSVPFGGRKVEIKRPRLRSADNRREVQLFGLTYLSNPGALERAVVSAMVDTSQRRYGREAQALLPVGRRTLGASRSSVGRRFNAALAAELAERQSRPVPGDLCVLYMDGIGYAGHLVVAAMGVGADGEKRILGMRPGTTENAEVCRLVLEDLLSRGLDPLRPILVLVDGGKGLSAAVRQVFGERAFVQRCAAHKIRNVTDPLPKTAQEAIKRRFAQALAESDAARAEQDLCVLARELEVQGYPAAAGSLQEGMTELLTVTRLALGPPIRRRLRTTNPLERA